MLGEALAAVVVGAIAVGLIFQPLVRRAARRRPTFEPIDPEETPRGIALSALKEIEFDRETGKLSDADYQFLKAKYTSAALEALRLDGGTEAETVSDDVEAMIAARLRALRSASAPPSSDAPINLADPSRARLPSSSPACPTCGPRPESDAVFCSACGRRLPAGSVCDRCGAALQPGSRFCEACGQQVAA